jgi:hypothetical protein
VVTEIIKALFFTQKSKAFSFLPKKITFLRKKSPKHGNILNLALIKGKWQHATSVPCIIAQITNLNLVAALKNGAVTTASRCAT